MLGIISDVGHNKILAVAAHNISKIKKQTNKTNEKIHHIRVIKLSLKKKVAFKSLLAAVLSPCSSTIQSQVNPQ